MTSRLDVFQSGVFKIFCNKPARGIAFRALMNEDLCNLKEPGTTLLQIYTYIANRNPNYVVQVIDDRMDIDEEFRR